MIKAAAMMVVVKFQLEKKPFNLHENAYPMSETFRLRQLDKQLLCKIC